MKYWQTFYKGATRPSGAAIVGAILVALGWLGVCAWGVTSRRVATTRTEYFMTTDRDEDARLTCELLRMHEFPNPMPVVAIVGDSATREAVTSENDLEKVVSAKVGSPVQVHLLVASAVGLWDAVNITDSIRENFRGLMVIEVSPYDLGVDTAPLRHRLSEPRWAISSQALREEAVLAGISPPLRYHNYFLDHYQFFVARPEILRNVMFGPPPSLQEHFGRRKLDDDERLQEAARLSQWQAGYRKCRGANFNAYARMIRRLRRTGISVALMEMVENPAARTAESAVAGDSAWTEYRQDIRTFAGKQHVPYWDMNRLAMLRPGDFSDLAHLRSPEGRQRFTEALATQIAAVMASKNPPTSTTGPN